MGYCAASGWDGIAISCPAPDRGQYVRSLHAVVTFRRCRAEYRSFDGGCGLVPCCLWLVACCNGSGRNGACCNGACCTGACCNGDCWLQPAVCTCDVIEAKAVGKKFPLGYPGVPALEYPGPKVPWSTVEYPEGMCARARRSGRVCARSTFVLADGGAFLGSFAPKTPPGTPQQCIADFYSVRPQRPQRPVLAHSRMRTGSARGDACARMRAHTHRRKRISPSSGVASVAAGGASLSYMQLMQRATCCMQAAACCMQHAAFAHAHPSARRSPTSRCATSRR
jgi:hypothetical protein